MTLNHNLYGTKHGQVHCGNIWLCNQQYANTRSILLSYPGVLSFPRGSLLSRGLWSHGLLLSRGPHLSQCPLLSWGSLIPRSSLIAVSCLIPRSSYPEDLSHPEVVHQMSSLFGQGQETWRTAVHAAHVKTRTLPRHNFQIRKAT